LPRSHGIAAGEEQPEEFGIAGGDLMVQRRLLRDGDGEQDKQGQHRRSPIGG
jgi:hypothetical protein